MISSIFSGWHHWLAAMSMIKHTSVMMHPLETWNKWKRRVGGWPWWHLVNSGHTNNDILNMGNAVVKSTKREGAVWKVPLPGQLWLRDVNICFYYCRTWWFALSLEILNLINNNETWNLRDCFDMFGHVLVHKFSLISEFYDYLNSAQVDQVF